jgi:short-subunit dehydrogenase
MEKTKTALITGASSGIGLAIAKLLLQNGHRVIGISRRGLSPDPEQNLFTGIALDLADLHQTDQRVGELIDQYRFDCFIHAAGSGYFGSIEQFSVAQIDQAMRVNLTSALILSRRLVPVFRRQKKGRMIFIGSESALIAGKKGALYSAAKFGLRGLCQALRQDCASDGVNVSLINPGMVRSPFFDDLSFRPGEKPENAIEVDDIASLIWQILQSSADMVFDEINVSPRVRSIDFSAQSR